MLSVSLKHLRSNAEALLAVISFGMASLYWLGLAFAMSAADYGKMMTLQAAVLIATTLFTFRTHDLVFNLVVHHGQPIEAAFRRGLKSELLSTLAGTFVSLIGALLMFRFAEAPLQVGGVAAFALIASIGANQGSAIAKLRYIGHGDVIAKADTLCIILWGAGCASIYLLKGYPPITMLIIGSLPVVGRTIVLVAAARTLPAPTDGASEGQSIQPPVSYRPIVRFLAGSQLVNFLKNAAVPIETMILAAFAPPPAVAMYRVARAMQGASSAAMNVSYQRFYPVLARAISQREKLVFIRKLQKSSVLICVLLYPLSAVVALGYALLKPEVGIVDIQLITAGVFLTLLAAGLQQGTFAFLSLAGDHKSAAIAYGLSFAFLAISSTLLVLWPRVELFMLNIIGAAFIRLWILELRSRRTLRRGSAA